MASRFSLSMLLGAHVPHQHLVWAQTKVGGASCSLIVSMYSVMVVVSATKKSGVVSKRCLVEESLLIRVHI